MLKEFKEFAVKGNAVDLAVGVIIGAAFGGVVTAIVNDILNPVIGMIMSASNAADLANRYILLKAGKGGVTHFDTIAAAKGAGAVVLAYGDLINTIINFIIVAFVLFLVVRMMNRLKSPAPTATAPVAKDCPFCTMSIPIKATKCPQCTAALSA